MLYREILSYINPSPLIKRNTTTELWLMPKKEFRDILNLYIKLVWILKSEWIQEVKATPPVKVDDKGRKIHIDFEARDFNYIIMSKWNLIITNDLVLRKVIMDLFIMTETYIESKLLKKNPQLEFFRQFGTWNFEWMEYVFDKNIFNEDVVFSYNDSEGNLIEITEKIMYQTMTKDDINLIEEQLNTSDKIKAILFRLRDWHFNVYKKFVIKAAEALHQWTDIEQDWDFMMWLDKAVNK